MGLRHVGQIGGGEFLGMTLTLDQAGALPNSQSPIIAEDGPVIIYSAPFGFGKASQFLTAK
jgi:hypothetical protein